jgi:hypothetical protein
MGIAICVVVWGNYWERFGAQFIEQMENLNTEPDEIIVSSPVPLKLPKHWVEILEPHKKWDSWNSTISSARSEWICPAGMDDIWFPDGLDGLTDVPDDVNVINAAWMENGRLWGADPIGFQNILHSSHNPMFGMTLWRKSISDKIPYRQVVWNDWIQWMEIRKLGYKVEFKTKPMGDHIRHPDAYSIRGDPNGELQCEQMRAILRQHSVVPGVEFPPQIFK